MKNNVSKAFNFYRPLTPSVLQDLHSITVRSAAPQSALRGGYTGQNSNSELVV